MDDSGSADKIAVIQEGRGMANRVCRKNRGVGNFFVRNFVYQNVLSAVSLKEIVMTKIIKKTHPGTIIGIVIVAIIAALTLIVFVVKI